MNKNFFLGLFVGAGLLLTFAFRPASNKPDGVVQKWEYKVVNLVGNEARREGVMNPLGQQGWEFVSDGGPGFGYFKRLLK